MDCARARELLSEALDLDVAPELAEARRHCDGCEECAAFAEGLRRLAAVAPAPVPAGLAERILEAVKAESEAATAAADAAREPAPPADAGAGDAPSAGAGPEPAWSPEDAPADLPPADTVVVRPRFWWGPRVGAIAATAAVVVFAVVLTTRGFNMAMEPVAEAPSADQNGEAPALTDGVAQPAPANPPGAETGTFSADTAPQAAGKSAAPAPAAEARFILLDGQVYAVLASPRSDRAGLEPAGTVTSGLGSGLPQPHTVFRSRGTNSPIFIEDGGKLVAFGAVTRMLKGRTYRLSAGRSTLDRFGVWPTLPGNIPPPTGADGSPTFRQVGSDDVGTAIFAPLGRQPEEGFAVQPGRPTTDPSGGNPNWTWWEPAE